MKGWKIILASIGAFLIALVIGSSGTFRAILMLAAIAAFLAGIICTLVELWCTAVRKPFAAGLVVLWGGIALIGFYGLTEQILFGSAGAPLILFGLAMWLHQRQKENPKFQEAERQRREDELQRQQEYERLFTIEEVRLIGGYSHITHDRSGGAILGYLLGGPKGSLVGAILGRKQENVQQFRIKYSSGRSSTEEHPVGSKRYRELMHYVRCDDL